jgi:hypothetical protein
MTRVGLFPNRDPVEYFAEGSRYLEPGQAAGWYFHEPRTWHLVEGPYPDEQAARLAFRNYCDTMVALGPW